MISDSFASSAAPLGSFALVLHAHLPYVLSHGTWPHGSDWVCEAAAETYIPLLNVFHRLLEEDISPRVTLGLTPILCEMLSNAAFIDEFASYLQTKIEAAQNNAREFAAQGQDELRDNALFWENWYTNIARDFEGKYERDIVGAFGQLQNSGHLEIITSAATHGYLPLLGTDESVGAQIGIGVETYKRHFGRAPRGIWLPECAYRPRYHWQSPMNDEAPKLRRGIEEILAENGLEYFVIDAHLLKGGTPIGAYGDRYVALKHLFNAAAAHYEKAPQNREYSPLQTYNVATAGAQKETPPVAVFARHERTALQVWSGDFGYPGEAAYLDFHKKHFPGGHRLWRVTSSQADMAEKLPYEPSQVAQHAQSHATHFVDLVHEALGEYSRKSGAQDAKSGIVCAPFDAELFGHWWFEGPQWLYRTLKKLAQSPEINLTTCGAHLDENPQRESVPLPEGSWGEGGFHFIWLNEETEWTWREIYKCEADMTRLASEYSRLKNPKLHQILSQCARELLLMQSSDWQFLISTVSARDYAELRIAGHINDFQRLSAMADKVARGDFLDEGERTFLDNVSARDRPFPDVDASLWARTTTAKS